MGASPHISIRGHMGAGKSRTTGLLGLASAGFLLFTGALAIVAQTNEERDPASAYAGKWVATNPGEDTPFLILTLTDTGGKMAGTMSAFTTGDVVHGKLRWVPLPYAPTEIGNVRITETVGDLSLSFDWVGDLPLHGGEVTFVAEGTDLAYINLPISEEESGRIFADHWGLGGMSPTIPLRRESTARSEKTSEFATADGRESLFAGQINEAEFQYKFDHGVYGDYPTLLASGQVKRGRRKINIDPRVDLSEHEVHLAVMPGGDSYQLMIEWKPSVTCSVRLASDQTGVIGETRTGACP